MKHNIINFTGILCCLIILFPIKGAAQVKISGAISLMTTDLDNNVKTTFNPGDRIRYVVSLGQESLRFVAVRGTVKFFDNYSERLGLQFERGRFLANTIFWDSIIPETAPCIATVSIAYFCIPGGFGSSSISFTVEEQQPLPLAAYVGTSLCIACHGGLNKDIVDGYNESGHHFALNAVKGIAPTYPRCAPGVPHPPTTFSWPDIFSVVGGYGWAAHFVNQDGYIITNGADAVDAQYNLPNTFLELPGQFVPYFSDLPAAKTFTCGTCHTTGYSSIGHQDSKEGIVGTWNEPGVGCEACHGPGSNHVADPLAVKPPLEPAQACANCHTRHNKALVEASDGLILSQQQSDELKAGVKNYFMCVSCHNPHASARYDQSAKGTAIVQTCTNCHKDKTVGLSMSFLRCVDCHMPYAVKSGTYVSYNDSDNNGLKVGDMRSHIFTINAQAQSPAEMFSSDSKSVAYGSDGKAKGLTLDFVCLSCHRQGGLAAASYTFNQVKALAGAVHPK